MARIRYPRLGTGSFLLPVRRLNSLIASMYASAAAYSCSVLISLRPNCCLATISWLRYSWAVMVHSCVIVANVCLTLSWSAQDFKECLLSVFGADATGKTPVKVT